ncbi:MAG: Hsp20/alpha crystallin family protein [Planctomycetes bacterium]|nr:Hsp20/alpha crystallin family protein [Planctomycetota bacterium]
MSTRQLTTHDKKHSNHPLDLILHEFFPQYHEMAKPTWDSDENRSWYPEMNIQEGEKDFVVSVELPGLEDKDVDINYSNGRLVIKGERKQPETKDSVNEHRVERKHGVFERSVVLGSKVDSEAISASFHDGVLVVSLPKSSDVLPRKIEIQG